MAAIVVVVYRVIPIDEPPRIEEVAPPDFPEAIKAASVRHHQRLLALPHGYDEPALVCRDFDLETAHCFPVPYSTVLALIEDGWRLAPGLALVKLLVDDGAGRLLWQRRSEHVLLPGLWSWTASGAIDPGESPLEAVRRETSEEIGVGQDALLGLRPVALLEGPGTGLSVLYRARLDPGLPLAANAHEVAELRWSATAPQPATNTVNGVFAELAARGLV